MKLNEIILLLEGGNALDKVTNGYRINKGDIPNVIKLVSKLSGIDIDDLHPLGSTGKSKTSGDIDLAIDDSKYDKKKVLDKVMRRVINIFSKHYPEMEETHDLDFDIDLIYNNIGTNVISFPLPVGDLDSPKGFIQVDFMFTNNTDWAKFAYHSPGDDSEYKGIVRTILLRGTAAALNVPGIDHFEYEEDGSLLLRVGRAWDFTKGIKSITQHRPAKKRGGGFVKTLKSVSREEFQKLYPNVEIDGNTVETNDPIEVIKILFGDGVGVGDLQTAEQVIHVIKQKYNKAEQKRIFDFTKKSLPNIQLRLPPELK